MQFRHVDSDDHPLMADAYLSDALVTDNEEGQRYWIAVRDYAFGQYRIQTWCERIRGEPYPAIFHEF